MVHGKSEYMMPVDQPYEDGPQQWPAIQVKRAPCFLIHNPPHFLFPVLFIPTPEINDRYLLFSERRYLLLQNSFVQRKRGTQDFMALYHIIQRPLQRRYIQCPFETQCPGNVIRGIARLK